MNGKSDLGHLDFFEALAERSSQVVFAFDINTKHFIYLSPSFEEVWNITRESVYTNPTVLIDGLYLNDKNYLIDEYYKICEEPDDKEKRHLEFRIQLPGQQMRWLSIEPNLLNMGDNRIIAGFLNEITSEKENEANVQRFAGKKNSLLEILSHDLSGPLVNIQGLSSLLAQESEGYHNPKIDKMIEMISRTSERSVGMIREFVKQEFLESVNLDLIKKRVNLVEVVGQTIDQYKASEKDLAKTFHFKPSNEEILIEVDEYKFNQVVNNLISNSIKFTPDGGDISIRMEEKDGFILFILADNGIGIPEKYHKNLFEKFTNAKRPGLKGEPSVGLGMSTIKTIVDLHNGNIWFESKEGQGTAFYIELPKK